MTQAIKVPRQFLRTTDVIPLGTMNKFRIRNKNPIHDFNQESNLPLKHTFSMLEAYNLILMTTRYKYSRGVRLYPHQLTFAWDVIEAVCNKHSEEKHNLVTRQGGKTFSLGALAYILLCMASITSYYYKEGLTINAFSPTKRQANKVMNAFMYYYDCKFLTDMFGVNTIINNKNEKTFDNGVSFYAGTANMNAMPEGETCQLLMIDEAQDVPDIRITKSLQPMTAHTFGSTVYSGSPTPEHHGYWYRDLKRIGINHKDVTFAPFNVVIKYSPAYAHHIKRKIERGKLHPDSIEFRSQYMLEWVDFESRFIDELTMRSMRRVGEMPSKASPNTVSVGVDPAKTYDHAIVTVIEPTMKNRNDIIAWFELRGKYPVQARQLCQILQRFPNFAALVIDTNGPGDGFCDILEEKMPGFDLSTDPIIRKPMNPENKSSLYKALRREMDNRNVTYPGGRSNERYKFEEEFDELILDWSGNKLNPHAPKGGHDDYPDSMTLALYGTHFIAFDIDDYYSSSEVDDEDYDDDDDE